VKIKFFLVALLASVPGLCSATTVKASFSGSITRMFYATCTSFQGGNCSAWNDSDVASSNFYDGHDLRLGQVFSGALTYESATPLSGISDDGHQAVYLGGLTSYELESGSLYLPATDAPRAGYGSFSVINDRNSLDSFYMSQWFSGPEFFATSDIDLFDNTGTVYSDFSVPTSFDLSHFDTLYYHLSFLRRSDGDQLHVYGNLSDFHAFAISVPEPSTMYIFLAGILVTLLMATRRRPTVNVMQNTRKNRTA